MRHAQSDSFDKSFDYRSVKEKLNYLERGSRSDISHAVYQCAKSCSDPKGIWEHHKMVKTIIMSDKS